MWNLVRRIFRLMFGWALVGVGEAEKQSPRALLEAEINSFQQAQAQFNQNLAQQAALIHRLKDQIVNEEKKVTVLTGRIKALVEMKTPEATGKAQTLALERKQAQGNVTENQQQLASAEAMLQQLSRQRDTFVKEARVRIETVKGKISKAEMAEAQAKLAEIASTQVLNPSGSLGKLEEQLDERIALGKGRSDVATSAIANDAWVVSETEQRALESEALADFAKEFGMSPSAVPAIAAPQVAGALPPGDPLAEFSTEPVAVPEAVPAVRKL